QMAGELLARIVAVPGVQAAGFIDDMFITGHPNASITIPGRETTALDAGELSEGGVTAGFFPTARVPLRRGRYLTSDDAVTKIRALWSGIQTEQSLAAKEQRAIPEPVVV